MTLSEPTLDDVFLRQTGRSLRDAGNGNGHQHDDGQKNETRTHKEAAA
jgi:hypothetical protein